MESFDEKKQGVGRRFRDIPTPLLPNSGSRNRQLVLLAYPVFTRSFSGSPEAKDFSTVLFGTACCPFFKPAWFLKQELSDQSALRLKLKIGNGLLSGVDASSDILEKQKFTRAAVGI